MSNIDVSQASATGGGPLKKGKAGVTAGASSRYPMIQIKDLRHLLQAS